MTEREIFTAALNKADPAERAALLDQQCAGNAPLRQRIESLLADHDQLGSFMDIPSSAATIDHPAERLGTVIGPYKLLQQVGEGGMGVVYMAEQYEPVKRRVALKIIKPGMDTRQVIARFEAERQALSLMDHPNIAKVLDAGTTASGRPYFVMELVKGQPITQYCDEKHLTPRQRLELLLPVCQAIQHAHQKGIIHRDIKPTNILVAEYDQQPVPKVIDFGVAKATSQTLTEKTMFTGLGQIVGTLEYMSPEQAKVNQLDIDTRSDIYSLGVLLYELLTGSTPFDRKRLQSAAFDEMLRIIREEDPPKPSTRLSDSHDSLPSISAQRHTEPTKLTKLVRGELDWIVMKALEKDRSRRYETANGFAADIDRYLADEPVLACPPSAVYRLKKFVRRNKGGLAVAGMVLFFLVLLGSGAGWALRDRKARELEIALETARKLVLTEEGIRQALDRGTKIRADLHAVLKRAGGVQEMLNQPARWELFLQTAQHELAQARQFAARAEGNLDVEWTKAMEELERQLVSDQADYDLAVRLERIRLDQATWVEGGFDERQAADDYPQALAGFEVLSDDPVTVAARIATSPIKDQLVAALDDWAGVAFGRRDHSLAEQLLAVVRHAAPDPTWDRLRQIKVWQDNEAIARLTSEAPAARLSPQFLHLVGMLLRNGNSPQKEPWLREAQAEYPADFWLNFTLAAELEEASPLEAAGFLRVAIAVRPGTTAAYQNLGNALHAQGNQDEAIAAYRKAIEIDPKFAFPYNGIGNARRKQQKPDEAVAAFRKAIEIDPKYTAAYTNLGRVLYEQKKLDQAVAAFRKAIELDAKHATSYGKLGNVLSDQKKPDEAIAAYRKAIELDPKYVQAYRDLGVALAGRKQLDAAIAAYRQAIELDPKYARAYCDLGIALAALKQLDEAIAAYNKAIELEPKLIRAHYNLGNALQTQGKLDEAIAAFRETVKLEPEHSLAYNNLGAVLLDQKQLDAAGAAFRKAIGIDPEYACAHSNLGNVLSRQGNPEAAIAAYRQAIKVDPEYVLSYYNLGVILHKQKQLDAAGAAIRKAIELDPDDSAAYLCLGNVLRDQKQPEEAIAAFRKAIELDPNSVLAHSSLGYSLNAQGKPDEAVTAYRRAIELDPKYVYALYSLGIALSAQGRLDEAVAACRTAIELDSKDADAYKSLGTALAGQGKFDDAVTVYRKAIEVNPDDVNFRRSISWGLNSLAWSLATHAEPARRDPVRAVSVANEAVDLNPQEGNFHNTLGVAQYRAKRWKDAVATLEKSMELRQGGDSNDWFFLAMANWQLGEQDKAREWYDKAVTWMEANAKDNAELGRFRAEAEDLMKKE